MAREHSRVASNHPPHVKEEQLGAYRSGLPSAPDAPAISQFPEAAAGTQLPGNSPFTLGTSFLGIQVSEAPFIPPDSQMAVGPNQIVAIANGRVKVFDRNGNVGALNVDTDTFFKSVTANGTTDPRFRYDRLSGRWFIVMIDIPSNKRNNRVMLAVSSGSNIVDSSSFTFFSFAQNTASPTGDNNRFADYPTLGIDRFALYIGCNMFSSSSFVGTTGFVINKSNLLSGTLTVTAFRGLATTVSAGPYTPQGVDNDDPNATEGYFIGVDSSVKSRLVVRRISNPGTTPTISGNMNITVPTTTGAQGGVPALGSTANLDDLDDRLFGATLKKGSLWTAHNIEVNTSGLADSAGNRDASRWYEITNLTGVPGLKQSGTLFDSSSSGPANYWIPTIAMSGQGHALLGCSVAGADEHAEIAVASRLAGDAPGTLSTPAVVQTSSSSYNQQTTTQRWGDYSRVAVDPLDDMTFWTAQEYCNGVNSWGVRIIQLFAPPPALAVTCTPASIRAGDTTNVVITGSTTNGAAYFDPGPEFPKHIQAALGNGITVNSVTFNNATSITASITALLSATNGGRFITVTNPDGQAVTSASALLTVTGGNTPPTISAITNQTINEDTPLGPIQFTIGDAETAAADLVVFATSSNTNLVPASAIVISGTDSNRTLSLLPATNQFGFSLIRVVVSDTVTSVTNSFLLNVLPVNDPPVLAAIPDATIAEGTTLLVTNQASDVETNALTFSLGPGAPANMTINAASGLIAWTPTEAQGPTSIVVSVIVTDNGTPHLSATQSFSIVVQEVNVAPVLVAITNRTVTAGDTVSLTATATDSDLPPNNLTFSIANGPAAASITPGGAFTWATTTQDVGTVSIGIRVTDDGTPSLSATQFFSVTVSQPNRAPVLAAIADVVVDEGTALLVTNVASDADSNMLTFTLAPGAPTNMTINATNGLLTWTPNEAQGPSSNFIAVIVSDDGVPSLSATQTFVVMVQEVNAAPVLAPIGDRSVMAGDTVALTAAATDSDLPANNLTFSIASGPAAASITPGGAFTWATTTQDVGAVSIGIRVTDDGTPSLSATQFFSVTVSQPNRAPVMAAIADVVMDEGTTLLVTNVASDADSNVLTFALGSGAPTNMTINATNGLLTWTPNEAQGPSSNFIAVIVSDDGAPSLSATQTFVVMVQEVNVAPVLSPIPRRSIYVGETLSFAAVASDTDIPANVLTFTLGSTAPSGASINGSGSFTWPTIGASPGAYSFDVVVTDDGVPALSATQTVSVTVAEIPRIDSISVEDTNVVLRWTALPGRVYRVQSITNVTAVDWFDVPGDVTATNSAAFKLDALAPDSRFYRLKVLP